MAMTWKEAIFSYLCLRHPRPVHYTDIAKWIDRDRLKPPRPTPENTVNSELRRSMRDDPKSPFRAFGEGLYGLSVQVP